MSEVRLSAPVKAQYFVDLPDEGKAPAGAFTYYAEYCGDGSVRGMIYCCPCGCGQHGSLRFRPLSEQDVKQLRASWEWNGNKEIPTLGPSVHHVGHWHGWLRDGHWIQA